MVKGTTHKAYPQPQKKGSHSVAYPRTASLLGKSQSIKVNTNIITAQMLAGNSTPEPATVMGMATVCTAGLIVIWFMRRKQYVRDQLET